ncbi:MAG TPA: acyl-CoA reductase [Verrucomicrobiae bacterium]|nr:acyl-CoA reductase [Verrucomicrobiae bacterium]
MADLPPEAELTAGLITEACQTLKRNRAHYLEARPTKHIIRILDKVGREWLAADSPFRQMALEAGPAATGFSEAALAHGLDLFFRQLTVENLEALLRQELGQVYRLDEFQASPDDMSDRRMAWAQGPRLLAHIAPGNIPSATLAQMVLGLLARSAQFVKCASGQTLLPRLFAHSLYEAEAKLGACVEVATWKGGAEHLEAALFAESDCVVVTGSDETLASVRRRAPAQARFVGYGTRVSFGYVTREALERRPQDVAKEAARAVAAWDQQGCLSPHDIYVETGGAADAEGFASALAEALAAMEQTHPRGVLPPREAAAIAQRRAFYEVRAAHSLETKMWASPESTAWTVILEHEPRFQVSCLNRFVYVKAAPNLETALQGAELVRDRVSTVGLACGALETAELAQRLARWGARRICPLGEMQNPPLAWRHDGRPALGDLLTWCDWEK